MGKNSPEAMVAPHGYSSSLSGHSDREEHFFWGGVVDVVIPKWRKTKDWKDNKQ